MSDMLTFRCNKLSSSTVHRAIQTWVLFPNCAYWFTLSVALVNNKTGTVLPHKPQ